MPVNLKKTEFAPVGVQTGRSSRTFRTEVTGAGGTSGLNTDWRKFGLF